MKKEKIVVLSPDGFPIDFNKWSYPSMKSAENAFEKWKERYAVQGYYSSNFNRIPLDELKSHCQFKNI